MDFGLYGDRGETIWEMDFQNCYWWGVVCFGLCDGKEYLSGDFKYEGSFENRSRIFEVGSDAYGAWEFWDWWGIEDLGSLF